MGRRYLHLYHLSDIHGAIQPYKLSCGDFGKLVHVFDRWAENVYIDQHDECTSVAVLAAGDLLSGDSPYCVEERDGEAVMECMSAAAVITSGVGNHDVSTFGPDGLVKLATAPSKIRFASAFTKQRGRSVILERKDGLEAFNSLNYPWKQGTTDALKNHFILEIDARTRLFVFSLSNCSGRNGYCWNCNECTHLAEEMVAKARGLGDPLPIVICLSHRGTKSDIDLVKRVEGLDIVLSGHSHDVPHFRPGRQDITGCWTMEQIRNARKEPRDFDPEPIPEERKEDTRFGVYPGSAYAHHAVRLVVELEDGVPTKIEHTIFKSEQERSTNDAIKWICSRLQKAKDIASEEFELDEPIPEFLGTSEGRDDPLNPRQYETPFGRLLAWLACFRSGAQVGIVTGGTIRYSLPLGTCKFTGGDLYPAIMQTNAELKTVRMKRRVLLEAIRKMLDILGKSDMQGAEFPHLCNLSIDYRADAGLKVWLTKQGKKIEEVTATDEYIYVGMTQYVRGMGKLAPIWANCSYEGSGVTLGHALFDIFRDPSIYGYGDFASILKQFENCCNVHLC